MYEMQLRHSARCHYHQAKKTPIPELTNLPMVFSKSKLKDQARRELAVLDSTSGTFEEHFFNRVRFCECHCEHTTTTFEWRQHLLRISSFQFSAPSAVLSLWISFATQHTFI